MSHLRLSTYNEAKGYNISDKQEGLFRYIRVTQRRHYGSAVPNMGYWSEGVRDHVCDVTEPIQVIHLQLFKFF
jgi:hypothetical protein